MHSHIKTIKCCPTSVWNTNVYMLCIEHKLRRIHTEKLTWMIELYVFPLSLTPSLPLSFFFLLSVISIFLQQVPKYICIMRSLWEQELCFVPCKSLCPRKDSGMGRSLICGFIICYDISVISWIFLIDIQIFCCVYSFAVCTLRFSPYVWLPLFY